MYLDGDLIQTAMYVDPTLFQRRYHPPDAGSTLAQVTLLFEKISHWIVCCNVLTDKSVIV